MLTNWQGLLEHWANFEFAIMFSVNGTQLAWAQANTDVASKRTEMS